MTKKKKASKVRPAKKELLQKPENLNVVPVTYSLHPDLIAKVEAAAKEQFRSKSKIVTLALGHFFQ